MAAAPQIENQAETQVPPPPNGRRLPSFFKIVRRVHLYMGLLMMPWVLLFGITALSFNHPTIGRGLVGRMVSPHELEALSGVRPWDPEVIANAVVHGLSDGDAKYRLRSGSAHFQGWPLFSREAPGGAQVVIVGLDQGWAIFTQRKAIKESQPPPFFEKQIDLPEYKMATLATQLSNAHEKLGIEATGPLRPHPEIHPELRFVVDDSNRKTWNVIFDLSSGVLDGRAWNESRHAPFVELLESLHKQHHYPANFGSTFFWALFADLTALMLITWALTGLIMWWQMKRLRAVGLTVLVLALGLAAAVMTSTAGELTFGPERKAEAK